MWAWNCSNEWLFDKQGDDKKKKSLKLSHALTLPDGTSHRDLTQGRSDVYSSVRSTSAHSTFQISNKRTEGHCNNFNSARNIEEAMTKSVLTTNIL